nr:DUF6879 family protein [Nocardiopsis sp. CNR-923]
MRRVHTLTSPVGDHLRFQFEWGYAFSVQAGEEVNILDFATTSDPGLPQQDFWLFDDTHVVLMHYAADGTQTGRELLEDTDPAPSSGTRTWPWSTPPPSPSTTRSAD